ncbi:MAG: HAMP domain-containing histidine kinase [Gemmatimonadaceae bacterium]|nr:HAMP domain-containing histidine kinase [Gemmatimonadaceae bacterium]
MISRVPSFSFARWPWITPVRQWLIGILILAAVAGTMWNHRASERGFLAQFDQALPMSVALSADAIGDWVTVRAAHARILARVAAQPSAQSAGEFLRPVLRDVIREEGYRDAEIALISVGEMQPALRSIAPGIDGPMALAEFNAPVIRDGQTVAFVRLRAGLMEQGLPHFNIAATDDRTQRTVLLVRDGADSTAPMPLLVASAPGGGSRSAATVSMPEGISPERAARSSYATANAVARQPHGPGIGITGAAVYYAAAAVPGTPWLLVREREVNELTSLIRPSLFITDAIFSALTALVIGTLLLRWRGQHQRDETAAMQLRATFVASVSHELRTPLTQVRMYAEMLRLHLLTTPEERTRALSVIEKEAGRLTLLIERSLAFVRTGQAPPPPPQQSLIVAEAVQRARDAIAAIADERQVRIRAAVEPRLTAQIAGDDLHQILLNLLDNAIKYGPVGQEVRISAHRVEQRVRLMVRDQGNGVPTTEREIVWQPFLRGRSAASGATGGTGIGLFVVRDLAQRAGGHAWVSDASDDALEDLSPSASPIVPGGALFIVDLPPGT